MKRLNFSYTPLALAIFVGAFFAWCYRDLIHIPYIDPFLMVRQAGPETEQYWHIRDLLTYFEKALPWGIAAYFIPVRLRLLKAVAVCLLIAWIVTFAILLFNPGWEQSTIAPLAILTGMGWAYLCNALFWSVQPVREEIRPGRAYLISKPPRTFLEWIGTFAGRWAGTVEIYSDGYRYYFSRRAGKYIRRYQPDYRPGNGLSIETLPHTPAEIDKRADSHLGRLWFPWANCFTVARDILKDG